MTQDNGPWGRQPSTPAPRSRRRPPVVVWLGLCAALVGLILALAHAFPEAVTTSSDWAAVARAAILVVLVAAGVVRARMVMRPQHLKYAAIWAGVIALLALGVAYRGEFAGVVQHLKLAFSDGDPVVTAPHELVVPQGADGAYSLVAQVNGQRVRFVVDTGATDTVLSPDDARRIGIDMNHLRYVSEAETANGTGYGAPYVAETFDVGPIQLADFRLTVNQAPLSTSLEKRSLVALPSSWNSSIRS